MMKHPLPLTVARNGNTGPLRIHLDMSCTLGLRTALIEAPLLFVETDPSLADVIVFGSDKIAYINQSALYRAYKSKSLCITETDIPTFRLPGLYASNTHSAITSGRTKTMSYFISERERGNPEVKRLIGQNIEKRYLYSFMGTVNSWTRRWIFRSVHSQADTLIEPTDSYNHWTSTLDDAEWRANQMRRYAQVMASSKFALCPRGCGLSSYRLFESMSLGVAPVIISNGWRPIEGIDWSFAIFITKRQIPQIDKIIRSHECEWKQRGEAGLAIYMRLLAKDVVAEMLYDRITEVMAAYDPTREAVMAQITQIRAANRQAYWTAYDWAKHVVLWGFYITGRSVPVRLNRPIEVQLSRTTSATQETTKS